jgi:hypothetical protein
MTRTTLLRSVSALASGLALVACIPPQPDLEGDTDTDAVEDGAPDTDELTTGADAPDPGPGDDGDPEDTDAATTGDHGDDGHAGDEGPSGGCDPSTHACLDAAPAGWAGPTALLKAGFDSPTPACPEPWAEVFDHELFSGFDDGGEATCTCGCTPEDLACEVEANLSYWDAYTCAGAPDGSITVTEGVALGNPAWVDDFAAAWRVNWSEQSLVGSCEPHSSQSIPAPSFSLRVTACGMPEDIDACDGGGVCTPRPSDEFSDEACVFRDGDHACPEGDYSERKVYYRDIEDTRGCPTCTCGEVSGSCTDERFTPGSYAGDPSDIAWDNASIDIDGNCDLMVMDSGPFNALSVVAGDPLGGGLFATCGEIAGSEVPTGEAEPIGAVTFCCMGA